MRILQKICSSIIKNWDECHTETPLQTLTIATFSAPQDLKDLPPLEIFPLMQEKLQSIISILPQYQAQKFDSLAATFGYIDWNNFFTQKKKLPISNVWKEWTAQLNSDNLINFQMFIDLFENVQIRSMSEAVCETIGSMMVSHTGKGRYLQPAYFSQEMYLQFNLGPLHHLTNLCQEIVKDNKKRIYS